MPRNVSNKSLPIEHHSSSPRGGDSSRALTTTNGSSTSDPETDDDITIAADDKLSITEHVEDQDQQPEGDHQVNPADKSKQQADFMITSPSPTFVTISEIRSPVVLTTDDDDADDDEPEDEAAQQKRIEELSRRIMVEKERLEKLEAVKREALAAEEKGLDTVSERSEDEEEKSERRKLMRRSSVSSITKADHRFKSKGDRRMAAVFGSLWQNLVFRCSVLRPRQLMLAHFFCLS